MSLFVASLNSGSSGNCYYIGNEQEAVLVDAGISCREIESRMKNLGLELEKVKAVFISHEHTDHICGVDKLAKKYQLPVYITQPTRNNTGLPLKRVQILPFRASVPVAVGNLKVVPFTKKHDAIDPYSFIIEYDGIRVGVITDIGIACSEVKHYFSQCHACFLESNYDEEMLMKGSYPEKLKKRIRGGYGHISNKEALELFKRYRAPYLSHLFLSHLSQNNNNPDLVHRLFQQHAGDTEIIIASRHKETAVYKVTSGNSPENAIRIRYSQSVQMMLFD